MLQPFAAGLPLRELFCEEQPHAAHWRPASHKEEKMAAIAEALSESSVEHPVFYEDGSDIHFDSKIGADRQLHGQQKRVVTTGKNEIIWLARCTAAQEKSVTSAAAVKIRGCLSAY